MDALAIVKGPSTLDETDLIGFIAEVSVFLAYDLPEVSGCGGIDSVGVNLAKVWLLLMQLDHVLDVLSVDEGKVRRDHG